MFLLDDTTFFTIIILSKLPLLPTNIKCCLLVDHKHPHRGNPCTREEFQNTCPQNMERSRSPLLLYLYLCIQTGMTKMFTKCQRTKDNVMEAEAEHLEVGRVPSPIPPYCEVGCGDGRNSAAATCPYCSNSYIHVYMYVCTQYT